VKRGKDLLRRTPRYSPQVDKMREGGLTINEKPVLYEKVGMGVIFCELRRLCYDTGAAE